MTESANDVRARPHNRWGILLSLAFVVAAAMPMLSARGATPVAVDIQKFAFVPKELTVPAGTTIVWTNHDQTPHQIADRAKTFVSKAMDTDDHYSFTFDKPGDYSYFCTLHPFMTGIVHVSRK